MSMEYENITTMPFLNHTEENTNSFASMPGFKVIFTLILIVIMFGMGCAVDHKKLIANLKKPVGISVGLGCQIFLVPVITYGLIKLSSMTPLQALALMLVGCSPGGSNSNVITYLIHGDISLSVAMTSFSNMLALVTVPVWLLIFMSIEHIDDNIKIPYESLGITLLSIAISIILGMGFRYKYPQHSKIIPKVCSGIALVILLITIIVLIVVTRVEFKFAAETILPTAFLPIIGMVISYLIACIPPLNLQGRSKKAIAIEVGIQNSGLANSVLFLTYGDRPQCIAEVITIPLIYNIFQTAYIFIIVSGYRIWFCQRNKRQQDEENVVGVANDDKYENQQVRFTEADPFCTSEKA
ncbi:ileal sodium/bile acid cotransporter-like [Styela clava]